MSTLLYVLEIILVIFPQMKHFIYVSKTRLKIQKLPFRVNKKKKNSLRPETSTN